MVSNRDDEATLQCVRDGIEIMGEPGLRSLVGDSGDLSVLVRRYWAWRFLHNPLVPFFTIDELSRELENVLAFRRDHADAIKLYGFAGAPKAAAPWTVMHFAAVLSEDTLAWLGSHASVSNEDLAWLRGDRQRLFDAGNAILGMAVRALQTGGEGTLEDDALGALKALYLREEAYRHLAAEAGAPDVRRPARHAGPRALPVPGFSALLTAVGLVRRELGPGRMSTVKTALLDVVGQSSAAGFYDAIDAHGYDAVGCVLDELATGRDAHARFWQEFDSRVNVAIDNFDVEELGVRIPVAHQARFRARMQMYGAIEAEHLAAHGELTPLQATMGIVATADEPANELTWKKGGWLVRYDDEELVCADVEGLRYVAELLERPNQPIPDVVLYEAVQGAPVADELAETARELSTRRVEDNDRDAVKAQIRAAEAVVADLRAANADAGRIAAAERVRQVLAGGLTNTGQHYDTIRKAIARVRQALKRDGASELAEHLKNSIRSGATFLYAPPPGTRPWRVTPAPRGRGGVSS